MSVQMSTKHFFYVILCADNTLYAGYTTSLKERLTTHRARQGAKYLKVKKRHPLQLIYAEEWPTKRRAMQAEYRFKQLSRPAKEAYLAANGRTDLKAQALTLVRKEDLEDEDSKKL